MRQLGLAVILLALGCTTSEPASGNVSEQPASERPPAEPVATSNQAAEPVATPNETTEPATEPAPGCDSTAAKAVAVALETAVNEGVASKFLADCQPSALVCASEREPIPWTQTCQIVTYPASDRWDVVVIPRPATGAPTRIEIWVDKAGEESGRVQISGSTFGVVEDVRIEGRGEYTSHTHGGEPAYIGGARFVVDNPRDTPIELKLKKTRWLMAFSCELPREERARPKPAGIALDDGLIDGTTMKVTVPAATRQDVHIGYAVQSAYTSWCERFAIGATFEVDGRTVEVIAEHRVVRREPLRGP